MKPSFLLFESIVSMVLIALFLSGFMQLTQSTRTSVDIQSPNLLYSLAVQSACQEEDHTQSVLGYSYEQRSRTVNDTYLNENVLFREYRLNDTIVLTSRCYEKQNTNLLSKEL